MSNEGKIHLCNQGGGIKCISSQSTFQLGSLPNDSSGLQSDSCHVYGHVWLKTHAHKQKSKDTEWPNVMKCAQKCKYAEKRNSRSTTSCIFLEHHKYARFKYLLLQSEVGGWTWQRLQVWKWSADSVSRVPHIFRYEAPFRLFIYFPGGNRKTPVVHVCVHNC